MRLTNKLAIITGAGSGFGAGIARRFAEEGCRVVVNDIDAKSGERVAKEIHGTFIQADVTKGADWARLVRAAARRSTSGEQRRLDAPEQALPGGLRGRFDKV
jgi:3-oxoacyl-[acyl-carrier protein] reductase